MQPARLWKPKDDNRVQCGLCAHFCLIDDGGRGRCAVRENQGGVLHTLVYDLVPAFGLDPVEKKPLFHFLPGSLTMSFGTMGCNFSCSFCQNHSLSQAPRHTGHVSGRKVSPAGIAEAARHNGAASVSYTYSEPTVFFELMSDTAKCAHDLGLKNIMVSNGFQSPQCLDELAGLIDAANIDLKGFTENFYAEFCGARLEPVKRNLRHMLDLGWWVEVTTLVIPGLNDSEDELKALAGFIADELGRSVPWHVSRFHPDYAMTDRPDTPVATLETAWDIGRAAGLDFVYTGNVPGHATENTVCPACTAALIQRRGFSVTGNRLTGDRCPSCGQIVPGRWRP